MNTYSALLFDYCSATGKKGDYYVATIVWFSNWPVNDFASADTFFIKSDLYDKIKNIKKRSSVEISMFYNPVDKKNYLVDITEVKK